MALIIAAKDIRREIRSRDSLNTAAVFIIMLVLTFRFAFLSEEATPSLVASLWWGTLFFSSFFGIFNSLAKEKEAGCLDGLMLCPGDRKAVYLGKVFSSTFLLALTMVAATVAIGIFWNFPLWSFAWGLLAIGMVGLAGLVVVGTFISALTLKCQSRQIMMPVLLLPIQVFTYLVPLVSLTMAVLEGGSLLEHSVFMRVLAGFSLIFLIVSLTLFEYVVVD